MLLLILAFAAPTAFITFPAGPRSVASLGDVDGDGVADFAVGDVRRLGPGAAFVLSGKDGHLLARTAAPEGSKLFGCSVAAWIDQDADGVRDFVVGAPGGYYRPEQGAGPIGAVYVCSGKSGALIGKFVGREAGDAFGAEIAELQDIDGDGKPDLLVGAPGMGRAYVLSGKDGRELWELDSPLAADPLPGSGSRR